MTGLFNFLKSCCSNLPLKIKKNTNFSVQTITLLFLIFAIHPELKAAPQCSDAFYLETLKQEADGAPRSLTTVDVLAQLTASMRTSARLNPASVDIFEVTVGQEFYVTPKAFSGLPNVAKNILKPVKMRVVQILQDDVFQNPLNWKKNNFLFHLFSAETGRVAIPAHRLRGAVFSSMDFADYIPFETGEYVQIGASYKSENEYKTLKNEKASLRFVEDTARYIGKFVRVYDEQNFVISIANTEIKVKNLELIIPRSEVSGLTSGTAEHFEESIKDLLDLPIKFDFDEVVRYRKFNGTIRVGTFVKTKGQKILIKNENNVLESIAQQTVFKFAGGEPHTAIFNGDGFEHFKDPDKFVQQLLDGAGKISSLADYIQMSDTDRILTLTKYLKTLVSWTDGAKAASLSGLANYNQIICAGAGVCRHLSALLATILSEAGYSAKVVTRFDSESGGHAWVEVDVPSANGRYETFILDPSGSDVVQSLSQASKTATLKKSSNEFKYYANPTRQYVIGQTLP